MKQVSEKDNSSCDYPCRFKIDIEIVVLLITVAIICIWNSFNIPFGTGYDEIGHAAYIRSIATFRMIPHPFSGWATFHPPTYYIISGIIWKVMEPFGPIAIINSIRLVGCVSVLIVGLASYVLLKKMALPSYIILSALATLLTLPFVLFSASWIGNEALCAGFSSIACIFIVFVTLRPENYKLALLAGMFCGLAFSTKYTGLFPAIGLIPAIIDIPHRRIRLKILIISLVGFFIFSAPVLFRNIHNTGSVFPMTRDLSPVAKQEMEFHIDRSIGDYVTFPFKCLSEPTIFNSQTRKYNEHMKSVWGLTYASIWYDPFGHRLSEKAANGFGRIILLLGLCATCIMLYGIFDAMRDLIRSKLGQEWIPLLIMSCFGIIVYLDWTWRSATFVAVKASYLMPLLVPAAAFFARGLNRCCSWLKTAVIACCIVASLTIVLTFTEKVVYEKPLKEHVLMAWASIGEEMPQSGIIETLWWYFR